MDEPKTDFEKLARRAMFLGMKKRHVLFMLDIVQHQHSYYVNEGYEPPQWLKDKLAHYLKAPDAELLAFRYIEDEVPKGRRGVIDYDLIEALEAEYGQLSAVPEGNSKLKELRKKL